MKVSPRKILPSQDFLKSDTIAFIFHCIAKGQLESLPPAPIVRQDGDGNLIAIDGHNLIAVRLYRGEDIDIHLAKTADDGLQPVSDANIRRNEDLRDRFESALKDRRRVQAEGITTFYDLINRYPDLFRK